MLPSRLCQSLSLLAAALLLASCTTTRESLPPGLTGPSNYVRPVQDGAPWWHVDVAKIPDAVPVPHSGSYKNQPYEVLGKRYFPLQSADNYRAVGLASWYGTRFHGRPTANGELYDVYGMTAAHKTLPLPAYVRVTNLANGRQVLLRVNDRGPFHSDRLIDLSYAAAVKLGFAPQGVAQVKVETINPYRWWAERGRPAPAPSNGPLMLLPPMSRTAGQDEFAGVQPASASIEQPSLPACSSRWASSPARSLRQRSESLAREHGAPQPPAS